jgi:hypothetical protein
MISTGESGITGSHLVRITMEEPGSAVAPAARYSQRPKCYALLVARALFESGAAAEIGADGALLVLAVVVREDALRYERPPNFFNGQLMAECGWRKADQLIRARNKAVAAGWLHYAPGRKGSRAPAKYWATIPGAVAATPPRIGSRDGVDNSSKQDTTIPKTRNHYGNGSRNGSGNPPVLTLSPTLEATPRAADVEPRAGCIKPCVPSLDPNELLLRWNGIDGVTPCREMTVKRVKSLRTRSSETGWRESVDEALARVAASTFCRGGGDRGWRATIDWFLSPDTLNRLLEGTYEDRRSERINGRSNGLYTH